MAKISEIIASRASAGTRYEAAVAEFRAAYIDLAGHDIALNSSTLGVLTEVEHPTPTFRGDAAFIPEEFRHPTFAPAAGESLVEAAKLKAISISKAYRPETTVDASVSYWEPWA